MKQLPWKKRRKPAQDVAAVASWTNDESSAGLSKKPTRAPGEKERIRRRSRITQRKGLGGFSLSRRSIVQVISERALGILRKASSRFFPIHTGSRNNRKKSAFSPLFAGRILSVKRILGPPQALSRKESV
jgi:hypothetical protein